MANLKLIPPGLKPIQPYLKIAEEHEKRDPAITYWCRLYAVQAGLKIDDKSPENRPFLISMMDWLEKAKKVDPENEAISNDVVAQAHIENHALKLFLWADNEDRNGRFNKNVVKAFYTAGFLYDIVSTFGEPSEEVMHHKKYGKWKATYIHNCLKNGITPVAGPAAMSGEEDDASNYEDQDNSAEPSMPPPQGSNNFMPPPQGSNNFMPPPQGSNNFMPPPNQAPYPSVGGLFQLPSFQPEGYNLPIPGTHAPPSTPNGANQLSPSTSASNVCPQPETSAGDVSLKPEDYQRAQKYCKWAGSALNYEDVPTAIENLQKALRLLTTGQDR